MSVILDALRKSEHERQRSAVPGLSQVPTVAPRAALPRWAIAVMALLGAAVLVLGGAWLQSLQEPAYEPAPRPQATEPPPLPAPVPSATPAVAPPPVTASLATSAPPQTSRAPIASQSLADAVAPSVRTLPPASTRPASAPSAGTPAAPSAATTGASAAAEPTLPSAAALMAQGIALPPLKLELHGYAPEASARFVFINGRKYVQGQRLAEGPEVTAIAPNGAVLSYLGQRFLLAPE